MSVVSVQKVDTVEKSAEGLPPPPSYASVRQAQSKKKKKQDKKMELERLKQEVEMVS